MLLACKCIKLTAKTASVISSSSCSESALLMGGPATWYEVHSVNTDSSSSTVSPGVSAIQAGEYFEQLALMQIGEQLR